MHYKLSDLRCTSIPWIEAMRLVSNRDRFMIVALAVVPIMVALHLPFIKAYLMNGQPWALPLASISGILLFYKFLLWLYDKPKVWGTINNSQNLNGLWGYYLVNEEKQRVVYGAFRIHQNAFGVDTQSGKGHLFDPSSEPSASNEWVLWHGDAGTYVDAVLFVCFSAERGSAPKTREMGIPERWNGYFVLKAEEEPATVLKGGYGDLPPAHTNHGLFVIRRLDDIAEIGEATQWVYRNWLVELKEHHESIKRIPS